MKIYVDGHEIELDGGQAEIERLSDRLVVRTNAGTATAVAVRAGDAVLISYLGRQFKVERKRPRSGVQGAKATGELRAPMPGLIVDVLVEAGATVEKGDKILVLEAMKTQQAFTAPFDGAVEKLCVAKGDQVSDGELLAVVAPALE
ncbi:MAG TPA: biotin/lipoyl-containing protein [Fimbriimonadaceae bacterium]|nr:biotin/lipoyl-containing protein [Fimbriimonadaceae bacterium]